MLASTNASAQPLPGIADKPILIKEIDLLLRTGRYKNALALLASGQKISYTERTLLLAKTYLGLGDYKLASDRFIEYKKSGGRVSLAYLGLGMVESKRGNVRKAFNFFDLSIKDDPQSYDGYVNRGIASAALGNPRNAIADFTQALTINPYGAEAYRNRGIIYEILGDKNSACIDWKAASTLGQDDPGRWLKNGCTI